VTLKKKIYKLPLGHENPALDFSDDTKSEKPVKTHLRVLARFRAFKNARVNDPLKLFSAEIEST
jgi:hypothetical protein